MESSKGVVLTRSKRQREEESRASAAAAAAAAAAREDGPPMVLAELKKISKILKANLGVMQAMEETLRSIDETLLDTYEIKERERLGAAAQPRQVSPPRDQPLAPPEADL